jgi:hypothetical protein
MKFCGPSWYCVLPIVFSSARLTKRLYGIWTSLWVTDGSVAAEIVAVGDMIRGESSEA